MPPVLGSLLLMASLGVDPLTVTARDDDLRSRFLKVYPEATQRLEEASRKVCLVELQRTVLPDREDQVEVTYRSNGPYSLIRIKDQKSDGVRERVVMAHPKRTFGLQRSQEADEFVLMKLGGPDNYGHAAETIRVYTRLPFASHCYLDARIVDLMKLPEVTLGDVAEVEHDGKPAVRLSWTWPYDRNGQKIVRQFLFIFSPEDSWALQEYEIRAPGYPGRLRGVVRYRHRVDEAPIAEEFESWKEKDGERTDRFVVKALNMELKPAPVEEFTLRAFGLPDLDKPPSGGYATKVAYSFLGIACLAGLIAIGLRRYAHRKLG